MTPEQLATRGRDYTRQALERLNAVEAKVTLAPDASGEWVSLRRNIESALADLNAAFPPPDAESHPG